ncbi:WD repeat-containing protein 89-like [Pomacea canaliculata]|uniref:WD repeat-containing protein 89-like n=1 Tax=Pomacea canaliculata TaxID=400727 RepID=UPI000D72A63E|nr:WD repeat-containing protein 89-like [Pomacea canaliculata]XP_025114805.1 WD repeat-containing protein 89-like [Pomacea canaliculata]XP_025114806.1 WD repeat-containing protein 89-like [Pomacea canaliculata]XP_025114807.1 WD repeat-containing protein 89-like [Pomacea canaliculata]XP_025114808.1 WD repeat-containing protein 89-like [Pomacea canaliculata]
MEIEELLKSLQNLRLQQKSAVTLEKTEPHYVLDLASQSGGGDCLLAATSSNHTIRLFSRERLVQTSVLKGHEDVVSAIHFFNTDPNILLSSSHDKTVRCWDIRANTEKEVQCFQGEGLSHCSVLSCDINANDKLIAGGTEKMKDDVFLLFWDKRKGKLLGCYSESHDDDITQVTFHPHLENFMASGSTDGLLSVFDIAQTSEDDALLSTFNTEATVAKAGWCGKEDKYVYCVTHMDTLHMWDAMEGDSIHQITDIKEQLQDVEYFVDCIPTSAAGEIPLLVTGSHSGNMHIIDLTDSSNVRIVTSLTSGHSATVRCLNWDKKTCTLVTGAEDSLLCLWSPDATTASDLNARQSKMKAKKIKASRQSAPYGSKAR